MNEGPCPTCGKRSLYHADTRAWAEGFDAGSFATETRMAGLEASELEAQERLKVVYDERSAARLRVRELEAAVRFACDAIEKFISTSDTTYIEEAHGYLKDTIDEEES